MDMAQERRGRVKSGSTWTHRSLALSLAASGVLVSCHSQSVASPRINLAWLTATAASANLVATGDSVVSSLTVTNSGTTTRTVQFAPCTYLGPLSLRAYAAGASKPAWDSALDNSAPCFTAIESADLKPGVSHTFLQVNDVNEILGDSLPSGSYLLTVSGRYLTPTATEELGNTTFALTKHAVTAATVSFTTDKTVYSATAIVATPVTFYSFVVIARYANNGGTPVSVLTCDGRHPYYNVWGVGNNLGDSPYDPLSNCDVPLPPLTVAPGALRLDTIAIRGPTTTAADGTPLGPLYGQVRITYRVGPGCSSASPQPCVRQASSVFAVQLPQ